MHERLAPAEPRTHLRFPPSTSCSAVAFLSLISAVPPDLAVDIDGASAHVVQVPLAACAATDRLVSIESRLTYTHTTLRLQEIAWFHEFSFTVIVVDLLGDKPTFTTQDRATAKAYLPEDCRGWVMPVVAASLRCLLARVRPPVVYRVTKARNPDEKAARKHHLLTKTMEDDGYRVVESGTDVWGRRFWLLKRELTDRSAYGGCVPPRSSR